VAFVAAVSLDDNGHPLRTSFTPVPSFSRKAIARWAETTLVPGSTVVSDGLACFAAITHAGRAHHRTVVAGRKPKDLPQSHWGNTVLGNLKTSLSGSYHACGLRKYAPRYLAAFTYRLNRRFNLSTLPTRLPVAAASCASRPQRVIRAEAHDNHEASCLSPCMPSPWAMAALQ
jgi:hypothetical protein